MNTSIAIAAALAASLWIVAPAEAGDNFRTVSANPVAQCDGALPSFEGALRKRPTAIANEAATAAFITCSFEHPQEANASADGGPTLVILSFRDPAGTSNAVVNCTLVAGTREEESDPLEFYTNSATFIAGGSIYRTIDFIADEFELQNFRGPVNLSCSLPAGIEVNNLFLYYVL